MSSEEHDAPTPEQQEQVRAYYEVARQQNDIAVRRHAILKAAAAKQFTLRHFATDAAVAIEDAQPHTKYRVTLSVAVPLSPDGALATTPFTYIDRATLSAELYTWAAAWDDAEDRHRKGGWVYITDADHDHFWSLVLNFHRTTRCLPAMKDETDGTIPRFHAEIQRLVKCMEEVSAGKAPAPRSMNLGSELKSVVAFMNRRPLPNPSYVSSKTLAPAWYKKLDEFWTAPLEAVQAGRPAPCLWVLKPAGCRLTDLHRQFAEDYPDEDEGPDDDGPPKCLLEHDEWPAAVEGLDEFLKQPMAEQEQLVGIAHDEEMLRNVRVCSGNSCRKIDENNETFKRCARCKNVFYCSEKCQRASWSTHKAHCRLSGSDKAYDQVWVVVLPTDKERRPYAALVPAHPLSARDKAMRDLIRVRRDGRIGSVGAEPRSTEGPDGEEIMEIFSVCRGEPRECFDLCMVWDHANTAGPVNLRASAMQTRPDGGANLFAIDGPEVRVRGDAVLFRAHSKMDRSFTPARLFVQTRAPIHDCTMPDFDARFGIFVMLPIPEAGAGKSSEPSKASSTLLPLTPENEQMLADKMRDAMNQM